MAVVQNEFNNFPGNAYAGMIANGETSNQISRTNEDATAIKFGVPVYRGSGENGCTKTAGDFLGVSIANASLGILPGQDADAYPQYEAVGIMTQGAIWVVASKAVSAGSQVYATSAGAITDTESGNTAMDGWKFDGAASANDLVKIAKR